VLITHDLVIFWLNCSKFVSMLEFESNPFKGEVSLYGLCLDILLNEYLHAAQQRC
jgi:hypothetical protein